MATDSRLLAALHNHIKSAADGSPNSITAENESDVLLFKRLALGIVSASRLEASTTMLPVLRETYRKTFDQNVTAAMELLRRNPDLANALCANMHATFEILS